MTGISKPPIIGVLKETQLGERRVALVPADARRLTSRARIFIESGAGDAAGFPDRDYLEVGAAIVQRPTILDQSDGVLAIHAPADLSRLKMGVLLISLGGRDVGVVEVARARYIPHLGLERLPHIPSARSMDALASQSRTGGQKPPAASRRWSRNMRALLEHLITAEARLQLRFDDPITMGLLGAEVVQGDAAERRHVRERARDSREMQNRRTVVLH